MLPDFTRVKIRANRDLVEWARQQIPAVAPLLRGVATIRQHEGKVGKIVRTDESEAPIDYIDISCEVVLNREEMKRFDLKIIQQKLIEVSTQIGRAQTKQMLAVAEEAAESVGNVVDAGGELTPDKLLELFRKVEMEFDPQTLKLSRGSTFIMNPKMAAEVVPKVKEWEKDPKYKAEYERVMTVKREEWRGREANRKLVD